MQSQAIYSEIMCSKTYNGSAVLPKANHSTLRPTTFLGVAAGLFRLSRGTIGGECNEISNIRSDFPNFDRDIE